MRAELAIEIAGRLARDLDARHLGHQRDERHDGHCEQLGDEADNSCAQVNGVVRPRPRMATMRVERSDRRKYQPWSGSAETEREAGCPRPPATSRQARPASRTPDLTQRRAIEQGQHGDRRMRASRSQRRSSLSASAVEDLRVRSSSGCRRRSGTMPVAARNPPTTKYGTTGNTCPQRNVPRRTAARPTVTVAAREDQHHRLDRHLRRSPVASIAGRPRAQQHENSPGRRIDAGRERRQRRRQRDPRCRRCSRR